MDGVYTSADAVVCVCVCVCVCARARARTCDLPRAWDWAQALTTYAIRNGSHDNVTCMIVALENGSGGAPVP